MNKNNEIDFKNVVTFNLDEYYPISHSNSQSYHSFMNENQIHLFSPPNISPFIITVSILLLSSTLFDCVKCAIDIGIPEEDAFKMASETPAKMMGLNCGKITEGFDCDLIVVDDNNKIDTFIINGEIFGGEKR